MEDSFSVADLHRPPAGCRTAALSRYPLALAAGEGEMRMAPREFASGSSVSPTVFERRRLEADEREKVLRFGLCFDGF